MHQTPAPATAVSHFEVGQRYSCTSAHAGRRLEVVIGQIDVVADKRVVSVVVDASESSKLLPAIGHIPFGEATLAASCRRLLAAGVAVPTQFIEGYRQWKTNTGGSSYFTITVDQAVDIADKMMREAVR